jgi:hypothetical protein
MSFYFHSKDIISILHISGVANQNRNYFLVYFMTKTKKNQPNYSKITEFRSKIGPHVGHPWHILYTEWMKGKKKYYKLFINLFYKILSNLICVDTLHIKIAKRGKFLFGKITLVHNKLTIFYRFSRCWILKRSWNFNKVSFFLT